MNAFLNDLHGGYRTGLHHLKSKIFTTKRDPAYNEILTSGLFAADWYLARNPDVDAAGVDPLRHYIQYGTAEGRDPGPDFCTSAYLERYPDVAEAGINPLLHFIRYGRREGRHSGLAPEKTGTAGESCRLALPADPEHVKTQLLRDAALIRNSELFNENWYLAQYPAVAGDPVMDYLQDGYRQRRNPSQGFNTAFYLEIYQDVAGAGINPLVHYLLYGIYEGRLPKEGRALKLDYKLWGGFSLNALEELEALKCDSYAEKPERISAVWSLVDWHYTQQDWVKALENCTFASRLHADLVISKKWAIPAAWCHVKIGQYELARDLLAGLLKRDGFNPDCCLGMANTAHPDSAPVGFTDVDAFKLHWINRVFENRGLAPIKKQNCDRGLALDKLTTSAQSQSAGFGKEKISIVMPAYNAVSTIALAIESILGQTWDDIELIVVDDCSTDNTFDIARRYAAQDARVTAVQQPRNMGAYAARNAGARLCTGDFITVHDCDDWSHPQKLETQIVPLLDDSRLLGSFSFWVKVDWKMNIVGGWRPWGNLIDFNHSSFLFRRSLLCEIGEWDNVRVTGDTEFIWRAEAKFGKKAFVKVCEDAPLSFSLTSQTSLTQASNTHVKTVFCGLRRTYREAARWWHKKNENNLFLKNDPNSKRPFPAPNAILGIESSEPVSYVFVSDLSRKALELDKFAISVLKEVSRKYKTAVFHWPNYSIDEDDPIDDKVFEIANEHDVRLLVPGETIDAEKVIILRPEPLKWLPDSLPTFKCHSVLAVYDSEKMNQDVFLFNSDIRQHIESVFGHSPEPVALTDINDRILHNDGDLLL